MVSDGTLSGSVRIYARSAPADELPRALTEAFLPPDNLTINLNTLLLEIGERKF